MVEETKQAAEAVGVLGSLGLDGKLFLAQFVNVGIVVLIIWRWVWKPLIKQLDERAQKIERGIADAAAASEARLGAEADRSQVVVAARQEAKRIIEEAEKAMLAERETATVKTRAEVEKIIQQGQATLVAEKEKMTTAAKQELGEIVALAVERIAGEKLDLKRDTDLIRRALAEAETQN